MGNYYLSADIYSELLQYLVDEIDPDSPGTSAAFASYFQAEGNMYHCTNPNGYMAWLAELMPDAGGDYGLFDDWDQGMLAQSGQGGQYQILPLP